MQAGVDPESILVLTPSRDAATAMRDLISDGIVTAAFPETPRATREPMVRSVHSYAFAVLRMQATAHGNPPPRLITSGEQDAVFRDLLAGDIEDGATYWPAELRPALGLDGFASELRDLIRRASERGLGPDELRALGKAHKRPVWVAAGTFAKVYEHVMMLRGSVGMEAPQATAPALDAAELVSAAVTALMSDPTLRESEQQRVRYLFVDDAQHLDPQAALLVRSIGEAAAFALLTSDSDQAIYRFRGASAGFLESIVDAASDRRIVLTTSHRMPERIAGVAARIGARLPGAQPQRGPRARTHGDSDGYVDIKVLPTQAREAAAIADTLRRAHLIDGVPWSEMAVIVRSVPSLSAPLRRALTAAGVPVSTPVPEQPLAMQRVAKSLLLVLQAVGSSGAALSFDDVLTLLSGPIGGADPLLLRRLRRGVRRVEVARGGDSDSATLLHGIVVEAVRNDAVANDESDTAAAILAGLTKTEAEPLHRLRRVLSKAHITANRGRRIEEVLWAAWDATGLQKKWLSSALRGGSQGAQADRDLDAVVALFDTAAHYVDRLPAASLGSFVEYVNQQHIAAQPYQQSQAHNDTVTLLSAHASAGKEWDVVAVAGVQEGLWPSLRGRSSLLGVEDLDDVLERDYTSEPESQVSRLAPILTDERKLFLVACTRARQRLLITSVESITGDADLVPSRFLADLQPELIDRTGDVGYTSSGDGERTVLALPALVARLRAVVCSDDETDDRRGNAATQLARLAAAGVPGAHPRDWYGLASLSTTTSLWEDDGSPISLSPSVVEVLLQCPLRWMLTQHGGSDNDKLSAVKGTVVHTLAQAVAGRLPDEQINEALERSWSALDLGAPWFAEHEQARAKSMLDNFRSWLASSRGEFTEAGVEVAIDGVLTSTEGEGPSVRLRGRIDRLEHDSEGRPVIVDIKTAKQAVSNADAAEHAQLATYQVAAEQGLISGEAAESGGAHLLFIAQSNKKTGATQRSQPPLTDELRKAWVERIQDAARATKGPEFRACINDGCTHCPVRTSCPVHEEGRQVTAP
ncbi:DNA helicase [Hoyosella rhizosphaerae]|uniref:DNA 3'-5' helicase n=2 Tax=Hoyosella rhizosphaerae TaxID=1755582 RepID=A0A916XDV0_9ACTN|nr:DNA helicase [Hoyosella rhizosphaerae]